MALYKVGAFQASTDPVVVTGLGFTPKFLLILSGSLASQDSTAVGLTACVNSVAAGVPGNQFGLNYSTNRNTFTNVHLGGGGFRTGEAVTEIERLTNGTATSVNFFGLTSFDVDGFTLGASLNTASTWHYYLAIGGDDVTVSSTQVQNWPTTNGTQSIGGMSSRPDLAFFFHAGIADGNMGIGWSDGANHGCLTLQNQHNVGTSSVHKYQSDSHCIATLDDATGALEGRATCAFTNTGLDLAWNDAPPSAEVFRVVMISGVSVKVGSFTQPTTASTDVVPTPGVLPQAVAFLSFGAVANTSASSAGARHSMGLSDGGSFNRNFWNGDENGTTNDSTRRNLRRASSTKAVSLLNPASNTTATTVAEFTADNFVNGSFDAAWSSADATQRQVLFLACGSDVAGEEDGEEAPVYEVQIGDETGLNPIKATFRIQETLDAPDTCILEIETKGTPYQRFNLGDQVYVTENDVRVFGGTVTGLRERGLTGPNTDDFVVEIQATSYEHNAQRRLVTETFGGGSPAQTLEAALTILVDDYFSEVGVSLHPSQATGPGLPELDFDRVRGDQVLQQIAESIGYLWSIDFENRLRMWAPGDISGPDDYDADINPELLTGDVEVEKQLLNGYANRVILEGPAIEIPDHTDSFTGDGVEDTFPLTYRLVNHYGYVTANGSPENLGDAPGQWYLDKSSLPHTIRRVSGPLTNGHVVTIRYVGVFVPEGAAEDAAEIAQLGLYEHIERVTSVPQNASAQEYAEALLAQKLASKQEVVTAWTRSLGYHPGQTIQMSAAERELSGAYLLTQVDTSPDAGVRLVRKLTLAKSSTNQHDWRKLLALWSQKGAPSSSTIQGSSEALPDPSVGDDSVTNATLANMAEATIKGRADGAGTGDPTDLSADQVSTILDGATDPFVRTSAIPGEGQTFSGAKVYSSGTQSITAGASTAINIFATESYDVGGYWTGGQPSRLTITQTGYYLLSGFLAYAASSTGYRIIDFRKNGTTFFGSATLSDPDASDPLYLSNAVVEQLNAGDYVELMAFSASATVNVTDANFSITMLGDASLDRTAVASATESVSNDTLQDDDVLALSVAANAVYVMELLAFFTTGTSTAVDVKLGFTFPAAATMSYAVFGYSSTSAVNNDVALTTPTQPASSPSGPNTRGVLSTATTANSPVVLKGVLRTGANAGTLQFQWAQSVSTGGTPLVREVNSYLSLKRVA